MAELPFEIITEILLRLPVKSLLRFKCVCKFLNSLIKTPNFIKLHLNQTLISSSDVHLLKWSNFLSSLYSAELDFQHNNLYFSELHHALGTQKVSFFGSCNGVVCISDTSKNNIVLFNPLTKSHVKLPLPAYRIPMLEHECISYGFGYDSNNNDYKVLKIVQGIKYNFYFYNKAEVFSVNNHQWKSVQTIPYCFNYNDLYGALVNEALHYMVINQESDSKSCRFIACFDLRTECFSFMDLPCYDDNLMMSNSKGVLYFLRQLGGCLSVMVNYYTDDYLHMLPNNRVLHGVDLWVMKEYGNKQSWVKLFSTRFDELKHIQSCLYIWPIVYSKDGRRILIDVDSFKIGCYDLVSKEFTKFTSHGLPHLSFNSDFFVGSLVSLEDKLHPVKGSLPMKDSNR